MTDTITPEQTEEIRDQADFLPYEDNDEPNWRTHIVSPPENAEIWEDWMTNAQDLVDHARLNGLVVTALCGYKWVPKHNPDEYEACERCIKIAGMIMQELGE